MLSNYRPITMSDILANVYANICWQNWKTRTRQRLLRERAGFIEGYSMGHCFVLMHLINKGIRMTALCFASMNLKAASDTINTKLREKSTKTVYIIN